jgi:hypothetical protein
MYEFWSLGFLTWRKRASAMVATMPSSEATEPTTSASTKSTLRTIDEIGQKQTCETEKKK